MCIWNAKKMMNNFQLVSVLLVISRQLITMLPAHLENVTTGSFLDCYFYHVFEGSYIRKLLMMIRNHLKTLQQVGSKLQ